MHNKIKDNKKLYSNPIEILSNGRSYVFMNNGALGYEKDERNTIIK